MKMSVFLFPAILLCASCSEDEDIIKNEEPMKPNTEIPAGNNGGTDNSPVENIFTTNSTVDDVISNPAFGDFGYLLFPVDRNVSRSMTLADISSSNVYVWYSQRKLWRLSIVCIVMPQQEIRFSIGCIQMLK